MEKWNWIGFFVDDAVKNENDEYGMHRREDKVILVIDAMYKGEIVLIFDCFYHSRSVDANRNIIREMKINKCNRIDVIDEYDDDNNSNNNAKDKEQWSYLRLFYDANTASIQRKNDHEMIIIKMKKEDELSFLVAAFRNQPSSNNIMLTNDKRIAFIANNNSINIGIGKIMKVWNLSFVKNGKKMNPSNCEIAIGKDRFSFISTYVSSDIKKQQKSHLIPEIKPGTFLPLIDEHIIVLFDMVESVSVTSTIQREYINVVIHYWESENKMNDIHFFIAANDELMLDLLIARVNVSRLWSSDNEGEEDAIAKIQQMSPGMTSYPGYEQQSESNKNIFSNDVDNKNSNKNGENHNDDELQIEDNEDTITIQLQSLIQKVQQYGNKINEDLHTTKKVEVVRDRNEESNEDIEEDQQSIDDQQQEEEEEDVIMTRLPLFTHQEQLSTPEQTKVNVIIPIVAESPNKIYMNALDTSQAADKEDELIYLRRVISKISPNSKTSDALNTSHHHDPFANSINGLNISMETALDDPMNTSPSQVIRLHQIPLDVNSQFQQQNRSSNLSRNSNIELIEVSPHDRIATSSNQQELEIDDQPGKRIGSTSSNNIKPNINLTKSKSVTFAADNPSQQQQQYQQQVYTRVEQDRDRSRVKASTACCLIS